MLIPDWNFAGVIPPIRPGKSGTDADRSPYRVTISEVVSHFASTAERREILRGMIQYRDQLHSLGVSSGFQWLDGSFLEEIEISQKRPPNDIDIVTFFYTPAGVDMQSQIRARPDLCEREVAKRTYYVDPFFMELGQPLEEWNTKLLAYWYSLWSHRRDGVWKGFLQVDLDISDDQLALDFLNSDWAGEVR